MDVTAAYAASDIGAPCCAIDRLSPCRGSFGSAVTKGPTHFHLAGGTWTPQRAAWEPPHDASTISSAPSRKLARPPKGRDLPEDRGDMSGPLFREATIFEREVKSVSLGELGRASGPGGRGLKCALRQPGLFSF